MSTFEAVIGLEIHTQLATESKLFCPCPTSFGAPPNQNTCPVCLALPGALPVYNEQVTEYAIRLGLATHCDIRLDSQFARKNYFYPDLPKGYQISQYDRPICENGWIEIEVEGETKRIGITRIHIEEDAGKLVHESGSSNSYVDLNRAGTPLLEIVSEPDLRTPEEAKAYMEAMHAIVTTLKISDGDMEKGNFRCDANVSIRPKGQSEFGTRTETKNLNSFRFIQQAIYYEIDRQREELLDGNEIHQETRLWDAERKMTYVMRSKEDAHDYRYFPDPDLPVIQVSEETVNQIKESLPELPRDRQLRFVQSYDFSVDDAQQLVSNADVANYFESVVEEKADAKLACNWVLMEMSRAMNESKQGILDLGIAPKQLASLIQMITSKEISNKIAKTVFTEMLQTQEDPEKIVESKGLKQVSDTGAIQKIVQEVLSQNPEQVQQFKEGKTKVIGFLVGQVMKASKGQANPQMANQLLQQSLTEEA